MQFALSLALLVLPSAHALTARPAVGLFRHTSHARHVPIVADVKINVKKKDGPSELDEQKQAGLDVLRAQAEKMIADGPGMFAEGVAAPESFSKLKEANEANEIGNMYAAMFEITVDTNIDFMMGDAQKLVPSTVEISAETTNDDAVRQKVASLYAVGMNMLMSSGEETSEKIKGVVLNKLAKRVGMDGPTLDTWVAPLL